MRSRRSGATCPHAHGCDLQKSIRRSLRRLIYLSSRNDAGYAHGPLNPGPYAYESGFAVRKAVLAVKPDPAAPAVLWGPYLWRDGDFWKREDFRDDGTHPSPKGADKAASLMLEFFRGDPTARRWFTRSSQ